MEDWQGCLDPICQNALLQAKAEVERRGGIAITVEDFLLALLQVDTALPHFLTRCAIDLDELVRTVQCEQPLTTPPSEFNGLSSQLVYWLSLTRDLCDEAWVSVGDMLRVLVFDADRLTHKAYVAVLERVGEIHFRRYQAPETGDARHSGMPSRPEYLQPLAQARPFIVAVQPDWIEAARDLLVCIGGQGPGSVHCLWGESGSGRSSLIRYAASMTGALQSRRMSGLEFLGLDVAALMSSHHRAAAFTSVVEYLRHPAVRACLVIDPVATVFWAAQSTDLKDLSWECLFRSPRFGALLTNVSPLTHAEAIRGWLMMYGLKTTEQRMPATTVAQTLAVLRLHQPRLEREHGVLLREDALKAAASLSVDVSDANDGEAVSGEQVGHPGRALSLLERSALRLHLWRDTGSAQMLALRDGVEDMRRHALVQEARGDESAAESSLGQLGVEFAAYEADWMERRAAMDELVVDRTAVIEERTRQEGLPLSRVVQRRQFRLVEV